MGRRRGKTSAISCTAKVLKGVGDGASMRWKEIGTASGVSRGRWRRRRCFLFLRNRLKGKRTTCGPMKVGILHNRLLRFYQLNLLFAASSKIPFRPCSPTSACQAALGTSLRSPGEGVSSTAEAACLSFLLVAAHLLLHPLLLLSPLHSLPLLSPATSGIKGGGRRCPEVL